MGLPCGPDRKNAPRKCDISQFRAIRITPERQRRTTEMGLGAAERGAIVGEPSSPGYAHMAVHLALDLVLKNDVGLGQLTRNNEDIAAVRELAQFGMKDDFDRRRI